MEKQLKEQLCDIISLPEIKLIIELDDADKNPEGIVASFILTREIEEGLHSILQRVNDSKGCGVFIKGNYGSGKSHFLSYLYVLLQKGRAARLKPYPSLLNGGAIQVKKISLVKYPAATSLEQIILRALAAQGRYADREEQFKALMQSPLVLIIDELSEFLRSKPSPAAFYEDVRFLQFLGEFSFSHPLWIIASLQEWIEETGHIASSIFNRIKDRYAVRINLSSAHIEDIIDQRMIVKKAGARESIKTVFQQLKDYYPHLPLVYEDFKKTYPLHPFTVRYLAGLAPVLSQHRGVIHFVFQEVRKQLQAPADTLITPELIFDHFAERIREIPEYSPLVRVVYDYYKIHIAAILNQPFQQEIALSVIKLLILTEMSPFEKRKTDRQLSEMLLKKISTIHPGINYEYLKDGILDPLVDHQMYIKKEEGVYFIDTSVDEGTRIRGKIKALRERFGNRQYFFKEICDLTTLPYLPLKDVKAGRKFTFSWQNSSRECAVMGDVPVPLTTDDMRRLLEGLEKRIDGYFLILPLLGEPHGFSSMKEICPSLLLCAVAAWEPRLPVEEEIVFLEEHVAKHRLAGDFPHLREELRRNEAQFHELLTKLYFDGQIIYASGRRLTSLKDIGYLPLPKLLSTIFDYSLSERYPDHHKIMLRTDYIASQHLEILYANFIKQGRMTFEEAEKRGLLPSISGILAPLGLVQKKAAAFHLSLDAENELLSHVLEITRREPNLGAIRHILKKGRWGMLDDQINLILSSLIAAGHLIAYQREEMRELKGLAELSSGALTHVKPGKTLTSELLAYIPAGAFIWGDVESVPTPLTQKMMWQEAVAAIRAGRKLLEDVNALMKRYSQYSLFNKLSVDTALLNRLSMFTQALSFSLSPSEGVERCLSYLRDAPDMDRDMAYLKNIHIFFTQHFQLLNKIHLYLTHPSLALPEDLSEKKSRLMTAMEEFGRALTGDFEALREQWEDFYASFTGRYLEAHDQFYQKPIFKLKKDAEAMDEVRVLKKIALMVPSLKFPGEWWEVKRQLDDLPTPCMIQDLMAELYMQPRCLCGFKIGDEAAQVGKEKADNVDLTILGQEGLIHFFCLLQLAENREKLDSHIFSLKETGQKMLDKRLIELVNVKSKVIPKTLILPLLTDDALQAIEKAFHDQCKTKQIHTRDFINKVKGRRFTYAQLRELFLAWIGDEERSIIHVHDDTVPTSQLLREAFSKYGPAGEKILLELESDLAGVAVGNIEEHLKDRGRLPVLDTINWRGYSTEELLFFLNTEQIPYLKKNLRGEIFARLRHQAVPLDTLARINDPLLKDCFSLNNFRWQSAKHQGVEIFTQVIAPATFLHAKICYENAVQTLIPPELLDPLGREIERFRKDFENRTDKFEKAYDTRYLRQHVQGPVVILDGLRYDLWSMLKETMIEQGWKIKEGAFTVGVPSVTAQFRQSLGIGEQARIDGKSYVLLKWAERDVGKRDLRRFLEGPEDIKFLHFNFIDTKIHSSTLDLYPLYKIIKEEFKSGILPLFKELRSFSLLADHGFRDTKRLKDRYVHGGDSIWEILLPLVEVS